MARQNSKTKANEKMNAQPDALADLPLNDEQAEDSKAGTGERPQEYFIITMKHVYVTSY